jgi:DNA polymerase I-like protein with 3'-5' exonuclease and polymerase domains
MSVSWQSAVKKVKHAAQMAHYKANLTPSVVDWARLVTVDFETYYDQDYTLSKSSTSEYVRDIRFKAQMVGIKIGNKPTKVYAGPAKVKAALKAINWSTHAVLCHNTQFDGFILSHHYGIVPAMYYDTLSMARGLHSNEIGASLNEVAQFYGKGSKIEGALELTKGVLNWSPVLTKTVEPYCAQDVDLTYEIFKEMHAKFPVDEIRLVDLTCRMFCDPVLKVDLPRVEVELKRELDKREKLFYAAVNPRDWDDDKMVLKTKTERDLTGKDRDMLIIKRVIGSNDKFAEILKLEGINPPIKISPAWMKRSSQEREDTVEDKWTYAFAKDDLDFINLPEQIDLWRGKLSPNKKQDIPLISAKQDRIRDLIDCRLAVKSTTNITRAQRFLIAGAKGMSLPCGYAYYRAHTGRWGGNNKMNMQNLTRGGELRLSILAPKGHQLCVADSGQIEARVNGWLWGQTDLMDAFREADEGIGRDAYCRFADIVYGRTITKADNMERFVSKVCVLGLGFQMGAPKLQMTLAKGALGGPPVYFELDQCQRIVHAYRRKNAKIEGGWEICKRIIEDMAAGRSGQHGPICWEKETIWLPNGMSLKYPELRKTIDERGWDSWTYKSGDTRSKIYGGLLCENIVQALARIIVAWQMLQISKKYRVVMTTHDEVVSCVKTAQAETCFRYMLKWMKTAPEWCKDIPLFAEGGFATNYSK